MAELNLLLLAVEKLNNVLYDAPQKENCIFNKLFLILSVFVLTLSLVSCGDSEMMGFTDIFKASDTITSKDGDPLEDTFKIKVISVGVSSGFVKLNNEELMRPNDFKNNSFQKIIDVDLLDENTLEVEVRGAPGDQLCVEPYEVLEGDEIRVIYIRCVDREAGPPNNVEVTL